MANPLSERTMLERAARALGRIDQHGQHALARVTYDEIEALALLAACNGLVPVPPGEPMPEVLIVPVGQPDEVLA